MAVFSKEIVAGIHPFNKLNKGKLSQLYKICEFKSYRLHEIVYKEGDPPDAFYLLITGRLVALTSQEGKETEIELIKRGTCFGMVSLFTDEPHSVTARAIENAVVLRIDKDKFKEFLSKNHSLAVDFSQIFSKKVKKRIGVPKKIFQSLKLGIYSFSGGRGKTTYMANLARALGEDKSKKVIILECSFSGEFNLQSYFGSKGRPLNIGDFSEEGIEAYINKGPLASLCVKLDYGHLNSFFPLINYLSENYHFVLYELKSMKEEEIARAVSIADSIHVLMSSDKDELSSIDALIKVVPEDNLNKVKFVICEFLGRDKPAGFKQPIYATIPALDNKDYPLVLRRISRELAEKTVGLVLGSGGAFCFSQVGVLKVLEENNVLIDITCGSSMGALIAALWALGYPVKEIERIVVEFGNKFTIFSFPRFSFPFRGFTKSKKLEKMLKAIFRDKTFYDIKHTLRIVAFDFLKREARTISEGYLYNAVAASCAMPGVFEPIISKDNIFMDGGILNPLPVRSVLDYAKKIIAVNVAPSKEEIYKSYAGRKRFGFNIFDFIFGSVETMQSQFVDDSLKMADVVIHPDLSGLRWVEFNKAEEFIRRGETAAGEKLKYIIELVNI